MKSLLRHLLLCLLVAGSACSDESGSADTGRDTQVDGSADATPDLVADAEPDRADLPDDRPDVLPGEPGVDLADGPPDPVDLGPDDATDLALDSPPGDATDRADADTSDAADGPDPCAPRPAIDDSGPYVRVGVGFGVYEVIDNCDEVPIVLGIQGGAHIWGAFQAGGFDSDTDWFFNIDFEFEQEGEVVAMANYIDVIRRLDDPQGGPYFYDSVTVILDEELVPEDRLDIPGVLRLRLWRDDVVDLRDEVIVVPNEVTFD